MIVLAKGDATPAAAFGPGPQVTRQAAAAGGRETKKNLVSPHST
jgi:hypothetical protein